MHFIKGALASLALATLAACGGGGDGGSGAPSAEGYWEGDAGAYTVANIVLPDGETWGLWVTGTTIGVLQGDAALTGTQLDGAMRTYVLQTGEIFDGRWSGSVATRRSISATVPIRATPTAVELAYDDEYDTRVDLARLAGSWTLSALSARGRDQGTATIDASGNVRMASTSAAGDCVLTGSLAPVVAGKHPLRLQAAFSGPGCAHDAVSLRGVASHDEADDDEAEELIGLGATPARDLAVVVALQR